MAGKAMDKLYKFDENGKLVEVLVPTQVGFVGWYAGPEPPEGYLYCDGSAIGRETYSELFEAVGTLYGAGDGAETFNLPDARGVFFRGDGGNAAAMGERQGDAIRNLTGRIERLAQGGRENDTPNFVSGVFKYISGSFSPLGGTAGGIWGTYRMTEFNASYQVPTASENRPVNMALKPCIRYV